MTELSSWETDDGAWHVLGAGDAATVQRVLAEHAELTGTEAPQVRETELERRWIRRTSGDPCVFVRCRSTDAGAQLLTTWTPATGGGR
ncbi:hypothetical protein CU254_42595 (plasmid) [Amycolatopsis sp. AA4]|uniref:hypothetical protein n=1 Tax=Actinomycetes TaxID=1760 RepID=UPI0001B57BDB|nr:MULTISPECIES: hypothetical protein [Actinomycetes]ATY17277.1 hypothetical protein CU254_42595 [Amycolatopsis sp. AA4]